ncbi:hypothetical protein [Veillonella agrestimuris]|uniref:hypothetical protein n=1 Tax=Veillonella agrestimuris TaxID=2941340 RepID=UPI0020407B94|nr:hypothetical protein [Veillonella agrestimuris]
MKTTVKNRLIEAYNQLETDDAKTAIKYHFEYNLVQVNLYFDNYDFKNPSLCIFLKYKEHSYFTTLKMNNTGGSNQYLDKLNSTIRHQIIDDNGKLLSFFECIDTHILERRFEKIYYGTDKSFNQAMNSKRKENGNEEFSFIKGIKRGIMSDKMENWVLQNTSVNYGDIKLVKTKKYTFIRTNDITKRIKLDIIFENKGLRSAF